MQLCNDTPDTVHTGTIFFAFDSFIHLANGNVNELRMELRGYLLDAWLLMLILDSLYL
jgi:hypothetical protein